MTFTIAMPIFIGLCIFLAGVIIGAIAAIVKRDWGGVGFGLVIGIVAGLAGLTIATKEESLRREERAKKAKLLEQKEALLTMPQDWQALYVLVAEKEESNLVRKAYILDFLKEKVEPNDTLLYKNATPEISVEAYRAFCSQVKISPYNWLGEKLLPFVKTDVQPIIEDMVKKWELDEKKAKE